MAVSHDVEAPARPASGRSKRPSATLTATLLRPGTSVTSVRLDCKYAKCSWPDPNVSSVPLFDGGDACATTPLPKNTAIAKVSAASGKCKYEPDQGGVIWKLRRFPGDTEYFMSGEVDMMATMGDKPWSRPPITMDFQVPMFAASGLHVRFLKVFEKSNYQTIKWVRYITKAGQYQHRI